MPTKKHVPVLLEQTLRLLRIKEDGLYVDATFGRGGHSSEILKRLSPQGQLIVIDRDPEAIDAARALSNNDARVSAVAGAFADLGDLLDSIDVPSGSIDGMLFDLGVSSPQLDDAHRGFSFMRDGPLDMRMDPDNGQSVAEWISQVTERELVTVIARLGEEKFSRRIARAIVARRSTAAFETTADLASVVDAAVPFKEPGRHPATKTFQALRMYINDELGQLERVLPVAVDRLAAGGRLVVISFHSLEDRIVKRFFRDASRGDPHPPDMPVRADELNPDVRKIGKLVRPTIAETEDNPRARSSRLRCVEKIGGEACVQ